ncbi:MAG: hypothetical protein ABJD11_01550 [Gemmatimonadota bacterium]
MRRPISLAVLALGMAAAACSSDRGDQPHPTAPSFNGGVVPYACPTAHSVRELIPTLFASPDSINAQFDQMVLRVQGGDAAAAQAFAFAIVDQTLTAYHAGTLIGGNSSQTQTQVVSFVNGVFCVAGISSTLSLGALDPDGAAQVLTPSSPTTTVLTGTKFAGVQVGAGSVPEPTLLTITRLPDTPGPLLTPLDQYPLFYEFTTGPTVTFNQTVILGVCQPSNFTAPDPTRLRVAHNIAPFTFGSVEVLPLVAAPFLDCTAAQLSMNPVRRVFQELARAISPTPLFAMVGTTGLGGTTRKFSPFGAVDTLGKVDANQKTKITGIIGRPVNDPPSLTLVTPAGRAMPGITVTFTVTSGGGQVTGATQVTGANGVAKVGSWTLGTTAGTNTLRATASAPQGAGLINNPLTFTATAKKP